jgi:hypothetical protein
VAGYWVGRDPERFVFLDGRTFSRCYQIENVLAAAQALRQPWRVLECVCSDETARRRIGEQVAAGGHLAGNRDFQLYLAVKERFEEITVAKTVIDTEQAIEVCVERAMGGLR